MSHEILELLAEKKYSAVKQLIAQMEEADLAKLFEELEMQPDEKKMRYYIYLDELS